MDIASEWLPMFYAARSAEDYSRNRDFECRTRRIASPWHCVCSLLLSCEADVCFAGEVVVARAVLLCD